MAETEIRVGYGLDRAVADVAEAWKTAEGGMPPMPSDRIYVRDWETLSAALTPERYHLLRHLRRAPVRNVRELADALGRDAAGVDADIDALEALGLLSIAEDGRLSSDVDEISSTIRIAA